MMAKNLETAKASRPTPRDGSPGMTATLSHDRRTGEFTLHVTRADGSRVEITSRSEDKLRGLAERVGIQLL